MKRSPEAFGFLSPDVCTIKRTVLRDPDLEDTFSRVGWVSMPFLSGAEVAELVDGYDTLARDLGGSSQAEDYDDTYAEFSIIHSRPEFRRRAYELITTVLTPVADRHLIDHQPLIANYVNKPPGTGVVPPHQNFSVVDEAHHRSVSVWVALVDCVVDNGAMSLLNGSHRTLRGCRGMWAYQAFSNIDQCDLEALLTPVEVPAGHAVILDDAVVHYSPPNRTEARRLAIQFVMVPDEAPRRWFQQVDETHGELEVAVWEIDERWFFEFWHGDGDESVAREVDRIRVPRTQLDLQTVNQLLAEAFAPTTQRGWRSLLTRLSR